MKKFMQIVLQWNDKPQHSGSGEQNVVSASSSNHRKCRPTSYNIME